jgi:hypothetical protein
MWKCARSGDVLPELRCPTFALHLYWSKVVASDIQSKQEDFGLKAEWSFRSDHAAHECVRFLDSDSKEDA